jgi:hypothetical protein
MKISFEEFIRENIYDMMLEGYTGFEKFVIKFDEPRTLANIQKIKYASILTPSDVKKIIDKFDDTDISLSFSVDDSEDRCLTTDLDLWHIDPETENFIFLTPKSERFMEFIDTIIAELMVEEYLHGDGHDDNI